MKRYRLVIDFRGEYDGMEEDPNGSYVHHEDAMAAIAAEREQVAALVAAAEREACASIAEEACLHVGCTAAEAEGAVRRTRDAIADAIRKRGAL